MEKINMTQEKLFILRDKLPWGAQKRIAENLNVTVALVNAVLNGRLLNDKVIAAAIELAEETEANRKALIKKINQL